MIFWKVKRIKIIFHGKNLAIKGSQRWTGGILNFIINAVININII